MYRVLIVDDEPYIVDDMHEFLKGVKHLELDVYKAYSGAEALELLNRARIDIVISDIRMPEVNGMEILKQVRLNWPRCKVIFLTGYTDFDYIQSALRNEAVNYILKTEGEEEILKAVEKAAADIEKELKDEKLILMATEQKHKAIPLLQQEYILDLLQGEKTSLDIRHKRFTELEIPFNADYPVLLLAGRVDCWPENTGPSEKTKLLYTVQIIAGQYLFAFCNAIPVVYEKSVLLWLIQTKNNSEIGDRIIVFVRESLESIQATCKELLKLPVSFVLSSQFVSWDRIGIQLDSLKFILGRGIGMGKEMLLMDNALYGPGHEILPKSDPDLQRIYSRMKNIELLKVYLESGQKKEFRELFIYIVNPDGTSLNMNYYIALEVFYSISTILLSYLNRSGLMSKIASKIDMNKLVKIEEHSSWDEVVDYYHQLIEIIFQDKKSEQEKITKQAIEHLHHYIKDHMHEDISLIRLAETVHLNPHYLSRLYKQETGKNLSDYINEERMSKARELLKESSLKIHEIAAAVGYESAPYFTRFFKKETGMTPQEYRESVRE